MNAKGLFIAITLVLFGAATSFAAETAASCAVVPYDSLEFTNKSDLVITEIRIYKHGEGQWADNLLGEIPLKSGEGRSLKIGRALLSGASDMRMIYEDGKENIWRRLPLKNIFELTHNGAGQPEYEQISLGS